MRLLPTLLAAAAWTMCVAPVAAQPEPFAPEAAGEPLSEGEVVAQLQRAVEALREELFRPGARLDAWDRGGADPDSELIAAGAERHFFLIRSEESPSVIILSSRRISEFVPDSWRAVDSYGSPVDAVDRPFLQFSSISPRYVVATRSNSSRRGAADCTDRTSHAMLYELPGEAMTEQDETAPLMFRLGMLALEGQTVCTRYDGDRSAGWRMRAFLPDGTSLPTLERADDRLTIVPAGPLDRLMVRPAAASASAEPAT